MKKIYSKTIKTIKSFCFCTLLSIICSISANAKSLNIYASDVESMKITTDSPYVIPYFHTGVPPKRNKLNMTINAAKDEIIDVVNYINAFILTYPPRNSDSMGGGTAYIIEIQKYDGSINKYSQYAYDFSIYNNADTDSRISYYIENNKHDINDFIYELYLKHSIPSEWAKNDIEKALYMGIVPKDVEENYNQYITREQFCEMTAGMLIDVHRKIKLSDADEDIIKSPFEDIDSRKIDLLYTHGIISGKTDKKFFPDEFISEEEVITILGRISDKFNITLPFSGILTQNLQYIDNLNLSPWAQKYFNKVIGLDINFNENTDVDLKDPIIAEKAISMVMQMDYCILK